MKISPELEPCEDWALRSKRVLALIDNQVRSLRKCQLIQSFVDTERTGAYWGIAAHLQDYGLTTSAGARDDPFGYLAADRPVCKDTADLAATPTRLEAMPTLRQQALINWGYVVCDAALRARAAVDLGALYQMPPRPAEGLPYPAPA